ncbi:hypothetical protein VNI00_013078 [Paramarasmius palmivorus]|uniref:F-box domain-containing protein n=1 Tax=Paramarasmius palmivorus TaxID=297713 RepID=A0AAW0C2P5_9AGAR
MSILKELSPDYQLESSPSRAIELPELLRLIFAHCDQGSNARNASVCRSWAEISLDFVWADISAISVVFNRLGTVTVDGNGNQSFLASPRYAEWHRFRSYYARRVRKLSLRALDETKIIYLLHSLSRLSQPCSPIFPNLKSLEWGDIDSRGYTHHSVLFMHDGISDFKLQIKGQVSEDILDQYFQAVKERMPYLLSLTVEIPLAQHAALVSVLAPIVKSFARLESLYIPSFIDISDILSDLADSSSLKELRFIRTSQDVGTQVLLSRSPDTVLHALQILVLHAPYQNFTHFLRSSPGSSSNIHTLEIYSTSRTSETPATVKDLLEVCASHFPKLSWFRVGFTEHFPPSIPETPSAVNLIHFQHIVPILQNTQMKHFHFGHSFPIVLNQSDVEKIASSWKSLRFINLNSNPVAELPPDCADFLTLNAIIHLRHIVLVWRLFTYECVRGDNEPGKGIMRHMHTLSPGYVNSAIDDAQVAMFLSRLLPWRCQLEFPSKDGVELWRDVKKGLALIETMQEVLKRDLKEEMQKEAARKNGQAFNKP